MRSTLGAGMMEFLCFSLELQYFSLFLPAAASMAMVVHFRIVWVGKFVEVLFQCIASCSLPESTQLPAHSQFFNSRFKVLGPWWPPFYLHQGHRFLFVISNSFSLASAPSSLAPVQLQSPQPQSQFWSRYQRKQLWSPCDWQFTISFWQKMAKTNFI